MLHRIWLKACHGCTPALLALALASCSDTGAGFLLNFGVNTPENTSIEVNSRGIVFSWDAVSEASSYSVYRYRNQGCASLPEGYSSCDQAARWSKIQSTGIEDYTLGGDTAYYYRVMAHGDSGDSELSQEISAITYPHTAPGAASGLQVELSLDRVELTWDAGSFTDYFIVHRATDLGADGCSIPDGFANCGSASESLKSDQIVIVSGVNSYSWVDDQFTDGQTYYYVVTAYNLHGSSNSEYALVRTIPLAPEITDAISEVAGVTLYWQASYGATSYNLHRSSASGCIADANLSTADACPHYLRVDDISETEFFDELTGVSSDELFYLLQANNSGGDSLLGEEFSEKLELVAPDGFQGSSSAGEINNLQWESVLLATGYSLYRYEQIDCHNNPTICSGTVTIDLGPDDLSYIDNDLLPGRNYYYSLRASSNAGFGPYTEALTMAMAPEVASSLAATTTEDSVDLTWAAHDNGDQTTYTIYRADCEFSTSSCPGGEQIAGFTVASRADGGVSYSDSSVASAQEYFYYVNASFADWEVNSSIVSAATYPEPIGGLSIVDYSQQSMDLSWEDSANGDDVSYRVYSYDCTPGGDDCAATLVGSTSSTAYSVSNLAAGSEYYFQVGAYANDQEYNTSIVSGSTNPVAPEDVEYEPTSSSIVISWTSANGAATEYSLNFYNCLDGGDCVWDDNLVPATSASTLTLEGLAPGSEYYVYVRAAVADDRWIESSSTTVYTQPVAPNSSAGQFTLEPGHRQISLNWDTSLNSSDTTYIITRYDCDPDADACSGVTLNTFKSTVTSYVDADLGMGSSYSYQVTPRISSWRVDSDIISAVTAPAAPDQLAATVVDAHNVALSWEHGGGSITPTYEAYQYELSITCPSDDDDYLLNLDETACGPIAVQSIEGESAIFSELDPGSHYYYRVRALNASNDLFSFGVGNVEAITWPEYPLNTTWSSSGANINLSWSVDDNGEETTWRVYRYDCDPEYSLCSGYSQLKDLAYADTEYLDTVDIDFAQEYYYSIAAIAGGVEVVGPTFPAVSSPAALADLATTNGAYFTSGGQATADTAELYIDLTWSANGNSADETSYNVYRANCDLGAGQICTSTKFGTADPDAIDTFGNYQFRNAHHDKDVEGITTDMDPARLYYYFVEAVYSGATSGVSSELNSSIKAVSHPVAPVSLAMTSRTDTSADLSWDAGANGDQVQYELHAHLCSDSSGSNCTWSQSYGDLSATTHTATDLTPASYYSFAVSAQAGGGELNSTRTAMFATYPVAIEDLLVSAGVENGTHTLELSWSSANGAAAKYTSYRYDCGTSTTCAFRSSTDIDDYSVGTDGRYYWQDANNFTGGQGYQVVLGIEVDGVELNSSAVTVATWPNAPTNLEASATDTDSVSLSWDNSGVYSSNDLYAFGAACTIDELIADLDTDSDGDPCAVAAEASSSSSPYEFTSLSPGKPYYFAVRSVNDSGYAWVSDRGQATTHPEPLSDVVITPATTSLAISWSASANDADATSYQLYALEDCSTSCSAVAGSPFALDSEATSYTLEGLAPGSSYQINLGATADGEESNASSPDNFAATTVPQVPDTFSAALDASDTTGSIVLSWSDPPANGAATSYRALRFYCDSGDASSCNLNDSNISLDSATISAKSYTDSNVGAARNYRYLLQAYTASSEANSSYTGVIATASAAVENLVIDTISSDSFGFSVSLDAEGESTYNSYLASCTTLDGLDSCSDYAATGLDPSQSEFTYDNLTPAQHYSLIIGASSSGTEANSSSTSVTTHPVAVENLAFSAIAADSAELSYTSANGDAAVYTIQRDYYIDDSDLSNTVETDAAGNATGHSLTALTAGTQYQVSVSVSNGVDSSADVDSASAEFISLPVAASSLAATPGAGEIALSWVAGAAADQLNGAATAYRVYRYSCNPGSCLESPSGAIADSNTAYTDSGLADGEDYYYFVQAHTTDAEVDSAVLAAATHPTGLDAADISASGQADGSVELLFISTNGAATSYNAYRYDCGVTDDGDCSASVAATALVLTPTSVEQGGQQYLSATDSSSELQPGTFYRYAIGASSGGLELNATATSSALTAPELGSIDSVSYQSNSVSVAYTLPTSYTTGNLLYLSEQACTGAQLASGSNACGTIWTSYEGVTSDEGVTSYEFSGLDANTEYILVAAATNPTATTYSSGQEVGTTPAAPTLQLQGLVLSLEATLGAADSDGITHDLHLDTQSCSESEPADCAYSYLLADLNANSALVISDSDLDSISFTAGTTYYARAESSNSWGSSYSDEQSASTVPSAPVLGTAIGGDEQITVNWQAPVGEMVSSYHLRVYTNGQNCTSDLLSSASTAKYADGKCGTVTPLNFFDSSVTSAPVSDLNTGDDYYFRVGAANEAGNTNWSEQGEMDTLASPATNLAIDSQSHDSLELDWGNSTSSKVDRHDFYAASSNCSEEQLLAAAAAAATSGTWVSDTNCGDFFYQDNVTFSDYTLTSTSSNTIYYLHVAAVNLAGSSFASLTAITLPAAPTGLTISDLSTNSLQLNWVANSESGVDSYRAFLFNDNSDCDPDDLLDLVENNPTTDNSFSADADCGDVQYHAEIEDTSLSYSSLSEMTTYYFYVFAHSSSTAALSSASQLAFATTSRTNTAPVADTGVTSPQSVTEGDTINLDASASTDADLADASNNEQLTFSWSYSDAGNDFGDFTITDSGQSIASFTAPSASVGVDLVITLTVTDAIGASSTDTTTYTINNLPDASIAALASDEINEGVTITIEGTGSDAEGAVEYLWDEIDADGNVVNASLATTANYDFTAPDTSADASYIFRLSVTDSASVSAMAQVSVAVNNAPTAEIITASNSVDEGASITLAGSSSSDTDGGTIATYSWEQVNADSSTTVLGSAADYVFAPPANMTDDVDYTFRLSVTDNDGASDSVDVTITANNLEPLVDVSGTTSSVVEGTAAVSLDGSSSSGGITSYSWQQVDSAGNPISSGALGLNNSITAKASFDAPGIATDSDPNSSYYFALTIGDAEGNSVTSAPHSISVVNSYRIADAGFSGSATGAPEFNQIDLSWSVDSSLTYSLYRSTDLNCDLGNYSSCDDSKLYTDGNGVAISGTSASVADSTSAELFTDHQYWLEAKLGSTVVALHDVPVAVSNSGPVLNDTGITGGGDYPSGFDNHNGSNAVCDGGYLIDDQGAVIADPSTYTGTTTFVPFIDEDCEVGRDFTLNDDSDGNAAFVFTKLDIDGTELAADASSWSCVLDHATGLIWEVKTTDGTLRDPSKFFTWHDPDNVLFIGTPSDQDTDDFIAYVNSDSSINNGSGLCGRSNWRLPTVHEIEGLADYDAVVADGLGGYSNPSIDTNYFPYTITSQYQWYWTSHLNVDPDVNTGGGSSTSNYFAWAYGSAESRTRSGTGGVTVGDTARGNYVRLVSSSAAVASHFSDYSFSRYVENLDGTVSDHQTGLMWMKCSYGQTYDGADIDNDNLICDDSPAFGTWQQAFAWAADSNANSTYGYNDWRLPNIKELGSIVDFGSAKPAINQSVFPNTVSGPYWTSTPSKANVHQTIYIGFQAGDYGPSDRSSTGLYLRLVRDLD